jgi:RNA polymerase sigma-70 factor (ECF subfamily)
VDQALRDRLQQDLTRLAQGDREAFHPVFVSLLPLLRRFAARSLPAADAEDAAQEALVKVFLRAAEFDPGRDALSWILGIGAYEIKTVRRKKERRREDAFDPAHGDGGTLAGPAARASTPATPEEQTIARDLDAALDAALKDLGESDAATLRAFAAGERPDGVAPATFRKRVERGLARLRARWRALHGER